MYRDSFSETRWTRFLRLLSKSFRVGRLFGVEVRVYWVALVVMPLVLGRSVKGWDFAPGATYMVLTILALYLIIYVHEMGHIVAGWRYGIQTPLITLGPLGGVAHMGSGAPSPNKEIVIALAGPVTHVLWLVPVLPLWLLLDYGRFAPEGWFYDPVYVLVDTLFYMNVALLLFNLLPCFPMDGGRALRGFLAKRMHPNRATLIAVKIGMIAGYVFVIVGIALWIGSDELWGPILAMIGIANIGACKQEKLAALHGPGPYMGGAVLQPWESDADAWKRGASPEQAEPGFFAKRKAAKAEHRREAEAVSDAELDGEVDRVLDRLNEVGLDGLSAKERKILQRASKRRRDP